METKPEVKFPVTLTTRLASTVIDGDGNIADNKCYEKLKADFHKSVKVTTEKPPKTLNAREKNFVLNILKGLDITDSYLTAGYKCNRDTASSNGSKLLAQTRIKQELDRVSKLHETKTLNDYVTPFKDRFLKSLDILDDLAVNGNDYVKLSAVKEILDRVSPKITRNESVKYTLPAKEKERINKLLSITDVTPVDNVIKGAD